MARDSQSELGRLELLPSAGGSHGARQSRFFSPLLARSFQRGGTMLARLIARWHPSTIADRHGPARRAIHASAQQPVVHRQAVTQCRLPCQHVMSRAHFKTWHGNDCHSERSEESRDFGYDRSPSLRSRAGFAALRMTAKPGFEIRSSNLGSEVLP
jgi:hypothetical protein